MQAYSQAFAKVYNAMWGDFANRIAPHIHRFYTATDVGRRNHTLLDLCCGTGQLSAFLLENGFKVTGLDLSKGMLSLARENTLPYIVADQVEFVLGDAADYQLESNFGLVVSAFDALNHLENLDALGSCFRSTYAVMVSGGTFIFDLNTRKGLTRWNGVVVYPGEDIFYVNRSIYDDITIRAWNKITGFVRDDDGRFERFDETVYNTVFDLDAVLELLESIHNKG